MDSFDKKILRTSDLKTSLENCKLSIGSWITLAHPAIAEIMASAGFDWLVVDLEHSVITIREAEELIRIIELANVVPLVRLSSNNSTQIKRVMDAGASGVIVPMVNTASDAKTAVEAVKYPMEGLRGVGLARAQGYEALFNEYLDWQKNGTIVIVQIEHINAVNNLEEILTVPGVDGYIIGPYDLFDIYYNYRINKYLELNMTGLNIFDDRHKEMIGGAVMGRQVIMRLSASI